MTTGMQAADRGVAAARDPDREDATLVARARVGLWAAFVAIAAFTAADIAMGTFDWPTRAVRFVQLVSIGVSARLLRAHMPWRWRLAVTTGFVCLLYVTSAVAGALRHEAGTQPITGLAIAFATATTLQWGLWPQLACALVGLGAIAGSRWMVAGTLGGVPPHEVATLAVAFFVSVYIADQLQRYRRARDAAATAAARNEERFRALIERGSDVITIVDARGVVTYESPSLERLLGHPPDAALGRRAIDFVHPDDRAPVLEAWATALHGAPASVECRIAHRDGSWCDVEASVTNLLDHPAVQGVVINWRDVGDRKRAERERAEHVRELSRARDQALASTRAKSMFLANVSHEIRTPMNVIIGMTEMVLDDDPDPGRRENLERVRAAAMGLLAIINDILDASKIEAGKMHLEVVTMDVHATVAEAVHMHAAAAAAKGVALRWLVGAGVPQLAKGDPVRLRQTIVNLVGNAVKFTHAGRIVVDVTLVRASPVQVVVRVAVRDTGIGIPAERQAAIFESFTQAEQTTSRVYGGTGLGLAICRQLVELMGGRIGVESTPGAGSCFWFEVPLERAAADVAAA